MQLARLRSNPILNFLLFAILAIHFFFLLVLLISPSFVFHKKKHKPLIVKTIVPKPLAKTVTLEKKSTASSSSPTKQQSVQKKQLPQAAKKEQTVKKPAPSPTKKEPAIADKQIAKSKQPVPKKNPPTQNRAKISDSLIKELEDSIAKMENKGVNKIARTGAKTIAPLSLQIDIPSNAMATEEGDYAETLAAYLHQALSLPDFGEVKIQLSLRQDGTVAKVVVLKTQSEKNKQYLESTLPRLRFPRFDGAYATKKEYTFMLTFCNE